MELTEQQLVSLVHSMDCFNWVVDNQLQLSHGPWSLKGHEYQIDWLQCDAPVQCFIKGAQIGATESLVLRTLHGMIFGKYPQGALYLFPTRDDVKDFSRARFGPLIDANPFIGAHVKAATDAGSRTTDAANIKRIGKGFLYLRGARSTKNVGGAKKSSSQLKSIPVERIKLRTRFLSATYILG